MSQELPVNNFEWIEETSQSIEDFIKIYNEECDEGYFLEVDVQYTEKLHELHNHLPLLSERMELGKVKKFVTNLHNKNEYVLHIRNLKEALNHGLIFKKVHGVIKFNQKAWLEPYIKMNTDLRKIAKNDFEKDFFKLMNITDFRKTMENIRKHRDTEFVTTERRKNYLVSEPNYHTTKLFTKILLAENLLITMNKLVYLRLSILDVSKTVMYEFCYDYIKPKW